jgi:hypothetical protein
VIVSGVTTRPDAARVTQQARNASMRMAEWGLPATHLLLDYDTEYAAAFDAGFAVDGRRCGGSGRPGRT